MVEQPCPHCGNPEIIAEPVTEGTSEWALYQMMQGKKVASSNGTVYWQDRDDNNLIKYTDGYGQNMDTNAFTFLRYVGASGWQIYNEPEPKFKVGDWVEIEKSKEQGRITYISSNNYDAIDVKLYDQDELETYTKSDFDADFRKLDPSEVKVSLTLSGTVEKVEDTGCFLLNVGNEGIAYCLDYESLTPADAELVRELTGGGK